MKTGSHQLTQILRHASALPRDSGGWVKTTYLVKFLVTDMQQTRYEVRFTSQLEDIRKLLIRQQIHILLRTACPHQMHDKVRVEVMLWMEPNPRYGMSGEPKKIAMLPFALRYIEGHSTTKQPFLSMGRLQPMVPAEAWDHIPGAFHVTTKRLALTILRTGLKPGRSLSAPGRMDIHMSAFHPEDERNRG